MTPDRAEVNQRAAECGDAWRETADGVPPIPGHSLQAHATVDAEPTPIYEQLLLDIFGSVTGVLGWGPR